MILLWGLVLIFLLVLIVKYYNGWYIVVMISLDEVWIFREFIGIYIFMLFMVFYVVRFDCRLNVISLLIEVIIIIFFRIMWIVYVVDFWVYLFFCIMFNFFKVVFFIMFFCILIFFYFLGKWMIIFIWWGKIGLVVFVCSFVGSVFFNDIWILFN